MTGTSGVQPGMTAALLMGAERIQLAEVPRPVCPEDGLLLRVAACAVCGSDVRLYLGRKRIQGGQEIDGQPLPGHILGHEIAGVIHAVGPSVKGFCPGEVVIVAPGITCGKCDACLGERPMVCRNYQALGYQFPGGFAEYLAVPGCLLEDGSVNRVPEGLPPWKACLAEPLACTLNAQEAMGLRAGDSVLVAGAGPMGCLHLLLARQRGAGFIAVAEPDAGRRQRARRLGADLVVNPDAPNLEQVLLGGTKGEGFTAVIFAVSSLEAVRLLFNAYEAGRYRLLAPGARVNLFAGLDPGETSMSLDARAIHYQGLCLLGSVNSTPRQNTEALRLIASGAIPVESLVSARLPLSRVGEALTLAMSRSHLKVIVEPGGSEGKA
ncbi:MAG TPA: alcohol dehydrogenase catalytic domain-containing protein [Candidatus Methylomirabilis sp.]|nr:alcohol dehydrogenase catalytic domain-containing protein [Candidatus Methylomirabilis sp.]